MHTMLYILRLPAEYLGMGEESSTNRIQEFLSSYGLHAAVSMPDDLAIPSLPKPV